MHVLINLYAKFFWIHGSIRQQMYELFFHSYELHLNIPLSYR